MLLGSPYISQWFKKVVGSGELGHGYIFTGPEGVGKRMWALALASSLEGGELDWDNAQPKTLNDVFLIEPSSGSIGIDEARKMQELISLKPYTSQYRICIVNDAHLMTDQAANALLKISEEPPEHGVIILVSHVSDDLPITLISRFQEINFAPVKDEKFKKSFGRPGLAWRMEHDAEFKVLQKSAAEFIRLAGSARGDFVKTLVVDEDFSLIRYLDALILISAQEISRSARNDIKKITIWHGLLKAREQAGRFNLSPKLQLAALSQIM